MERLDEDTVALLSRRAYDVAASTKGVKVFLNNKRIPIKVINSVGTFCSFLESANALKSVLKAVLWSNLC